MICRTVRIRLPDFLGNRLSPADGRRIERHLRGCPECGKNAEAFREGLRILRTPDAAEKWDFTDAEWRLAIRKAVSASTAEQPAPAARRFRPAFACGLALLAIAAAVIIGVRRFPWLVPIVENRPAAEAAGASLKAKGNEPLEASDIFAESAIWNRDNDFPASPDSVTSASSSKSAAGDVPSFTWISPETGLQIVWFVNDEIQLEE